MRKSTLCIWLSGWLHGKQGFLVCSCFLWRQTVEVQVVSITCRSFRVTAECWVTPVELVEPVRCLWIQGCADLLHVTDIYRLCLVCTIYKNIFTISFPLFCLVPTIDIFGTFWFQLRCNSFSLYNIHHDTHTDLEAVPLPCSERSQ